jgi:peptidoglycan/xylan/chitin deacetylase (PgdA/CDA1 family)
MPNPAWLAALVALAVPAVAADAPEAFLVAVTVDDLPHHGKLPPGMTRLGIAQAHLDAFKAHKVTEAFGFVNAAKLKDNPEGDALLDAWRKAGHPLGNHTASHLNLERAPSLEAWIADVEAGEPAVASRMQGQFWRWLRFPNLTVGSTRRDGALAYLRDKGYRVADVSLAFSDWSYTDTYARCVAKGDTAAIQAMKDQYFKAVERGIADMKASSKRVYGRVIPQVLLTHLGGWSAATLPGVLARLDAAGARYITLEQAQSDPAYAEPGGGSIITRTAKAKGISLADLSAPDASAAPPLDLKSLCE